MKHKKISIIKPCCFVSYAWESDEHRSWVAKFVSRLQKKGVFTHFDEWDVRPGQDLQEYMEYAIRSSDFVLLICTPIYAEKADKGLGGVGYEKSIVTGEIFMDKNKSFKFVPVLRSGEPQTAVPSFLKSKAYIRFP
jgi:hypothetical protein